MSYKNKIKKIINNKDILTWTVIVLLGILILAVFLPIKLPSFKSEKVYNLEITIIDGCGEDCFDIDVISDGLKAREDFKIKKLERLDYNSEDARLLIQKFGITRIPAIIIKSKDPLADILNISNEDTFAINGDYIIFEKGVPYLDLSSNKIKGNIELIEIQDTSCKQCGSFSLFKNWLEEMNVKVDNYKLIDSSSQEGKELIEKNNITYLPSILIEKEIEEYWWIFPSLKPNLENKESGYLLNQKTYPYIDVSNNKIKGIVNSIYLVNKSCDTCFDISLLKESFQASGVYIEDESEVDISSPDGSRLVKLYNITAVPTIIFSKEISDYDHLADTLGQLGTIEKDGKFVFRALKELNLNYQKL